MPQLLMALIIALVFAMFGLLFFPSLHTMLLGIDTTGMGYLLTAGITSMPYVVVFAIVYGVILIISNRNNKI
jgi:ABC-type antimicrobial peptide transport system permease subunit